MDKKRFSRPVDLKQIQITDEFWQREQELVRTEVIPYQWEALNDRVEGAAPSYCMHNFRAAGRLMREKKTAGESFAAPAYSYRGFNVLPEDPAKPDPDKFYGFVFQDTDFSKWIEAVAYTLTWHPDPELERIADEAIDVVCAAQWENGYLDTYYILSGMDRSFTNLKDHHELYCLGHLTEGAVAYYQATGKDKLLKAACRFADYAASVFGPEEGKRKGYPGHEIAEMALVRLYEVTGCEKYLRLAEFFLDQRGTEPHYFIEEEKERWLYEQREKRGEDGEDAVEAEDNAPQAEGDAAETDVSETDTETECAANAQKASRKAEREFPARIRALTSANYAYYQAHQPVRQQSEAVGHAVRAGYLYSGMADVARLTGDEAMYAACERLWNSIVEEKLYITGGVGGTSHGEAFSYPYDLPNDAAYSETCAAIALAFFARRMLQIRPVVQYADVMEQALYNTVLAGMALDGKSFFYVNPLEVRPEACRKDSRLDHVKPVRQKWFGCACCPPNLARIVSSVGAYAYTENEDTLWFHLYLGGRVTKTVRVGENPGSKADGESEAAFHAGSENAAACAETADGAQYAAQITLQVETGMPWNGNVKITVCEAGAEPVVSSAAPSGTVPGGADPCGVPGKAAVCTLALRIPGWSGEWHADVVCGGKKQEISQIEDGYLYVTGSWQAGDSISLEFPMDVQMKAADLRVREDLGRVAFVRGPVTYCAEEADNGKDLQLYRVDTERIGYAAEKKSSAGENGAVSGSGSGVRVEMTDRLGHPMAVLKVPAKKLVPAEDSSLYRDYAPPVEEDEVLTLIPYYAWANRGEGEMTVWLRV